MGEGKKEREFSLGLRLKSRTRLAIVKAKVGQGLGSITTSCAMVHPKSMQVLVTVRLRYNPT